MSSDTIVRYVTLHVPDSPGVAYANGTLSDWIGGPLNNVHGVCELEKQSGSDEFILSGDTYVF